MHGTESFRVDITHRRQTGWWRGLMPGQVRPLHEPANYMQHTLSWEANSSSPGQVFLRISENSNIHYRLNVARTMHHVL